MHDPDARPRLRWRIALCGIGAVVLLSVLYVAAAGPLVWWGRYHYRKPPWSAEYRRSLKPLDRFPEFQSMMRTWCNWWVLLPAPRSWRRQYLVDQLAARQKIVDDLHAIRAGFDAEADLLRARLEVLNADARPPLEVPAEAIDIGLRLEELARARGRVGSPLAPLEMRNLPNHEVNVLEAEAQLSRFDAQPR